MGRGAFEIEYVPSFIPAVVPQMIQVGMGVLEPVVRKNLDRAIGNPAYLNQPSRSTGSLRNSIRVSNTFIRNNGTKFFANVFFEGHDKRGMRQGEKAAYLNYGTGLTETRRRTTRSGQLVSTGDTHRTRFASTATRSSAVRAKVEAAMQEVLQRELSNLEE